MLDIKNSRIKMIEELYLGIQLTLIALAIFAYYCMPKDMTIFHIHIKYFLFIYGIYLTALFLLFIHKVYFKNTHEVRPNLYLSFIDGMFLTVFIYLSKGNFQSVFHLFYIYIALQITRFYNKSSSLFSTFVSICYTIVVILQNPKNLILYEWFMNVFSFYLLSHIISSIIKETHHLQMQVHFMLEETKKKNVVLNEIATKDYLTNMYNHKSFYKYLKDTVKFSEVKNTPFCLTLIDIDNFKKVNDTYGHLAGDDILKEISSIIHDHIRKTDIAARYGGEEFAIIFPNTSIENARKVCERIRKAIEEYTFYVNGQKIKVTISGGMASAIISPSSSKQRNFVEFVDNLLYEAKHLGKNQIKCAEETICLE